MTGYAQAPDTLQAAAVLEQVRHGGGASQAAAFLTQEDQRRATAALDAFADSLVEIGSSYRRGDPVAVRQAAREARLALLWSARPERLVARSAALAERSLPPPIPYPGALEALVRVFEGSATAGVRGATLALLTNLPDTARVVAFLSGVATDPATEPATAIAAVRHLSVNTGDAGAARLRMLFETNAVPNPIVREHLQAVAIARGWREGPP